MASDPTALLGALLSTTGQGYNGMQQVQQDQQQNRLQQQRIAANDLQFQQISQEAQQQASYQADTQAYLAHPTPQALADLAVKYPGQADSLKKAWAIKDDATKAADLSTFGSIYNAADKGRKDLVLTTLQQRRDAEAKAGIDTSELDDAIAGLNSNDPKALDNIKGVALAHIYAGDPDKFATAFGIGKNDGNHVINPGGALVDNKGNVLYQSADKPTYEKVTNADGSQSLVQVGGGPVQTNPAGANAPVGGDGAPLSTRLNNPGAIRYDPKNKWEGQKGNVGGFVEFATPEAGARAQKILIGNQIKAGFDTPQTWAEHYAPASDGNDPSSYAKTIASGLGIGVNDKIPLSAVTKMAALSAEVEAGGSPSPNGKQSGSKVIFTSKPADSEVDDETVNFYAQKIAAGGDLPPLGMGKQAAALRQAILGKAAQIQSGQGMTGADSNLLHADVKTATTALAGLQKTRNSLDPFLKTFDGAADQVRKLAPTGVAGGIPLFNKWKQSTRAQIMGDPQLAKFDVALAAVANENAKIMSGASGGAVTSDSARAEAHALINRAQSLPQLLGALDQMQTDTKIRLKSLDDRQAQLRDTIAGKRPGSGAQSGTPVQVSSPAQAAALPSGTIFIANGKTYKKR